MAEIIYSAITIFRERGREMTRIIASGLLFILMIFSFQPLSFSTLAQTPPRIPITRDNIYLLELVSKWQVEDYHGRNLLRWFLDNKTLAIGGNHSNYITIIDITTGNIVQSLALSEPVSDFELIVNDTLISIVSPLFEGIVYWNLEEHSSEIILNDEFTPIFCIAFSGDERFFAIGPFPPLDVLTPIRVYDLHKLEVLTELWPENPNPVMSITYSPNGEMLAAQIGSEIRVWDSTYNSIAYFGMLDETALSLTFSPDNTQLAIPNFQQNSIYIWNITSQQPTHILTDHTDYIWDIAYNRDGTLLVSASQDGSVQLWDTETGRALKVLEGDHYGITNIAFSPDGTLLATISEDGTIKIWAVID